MSSKPLSVVQPASVPNPTGTPEFEALRKSMLDDFSSKVPPEFRLPQSLIDNPPKDVTAIPRGCGILSPEEIEITEKHDATSLAAAIAAKKYTAVAVAKAFCKRAIVAHQLVCCVMDWFMDEALEQAQALDDHLARTGQTVGPLHGVPFSVKEHMPLRGRWSSWGFMDTRVRSGEDCHMMAIMRRAGVVFYCKTIQPQSIMHLESPSVYGRVLNPYNINLTAGGSTGGEAALVAMRGSVLGIGTDIGGSVRCPAGFCGIYGFKPTSYTLPMRDFNPGGFAAELNVLVSTGPMCTSLRDMDLFMSIMSAAKPYLEDPRLIPIPWKGLAGEPASKPLKIGIMMGDGVITPQPPVIRALKWAKSRLSSNASFEIKDFAPYGMATAMKNIRKAYYPDGGQSVKAHLAKTGEPMFPLTQWIIQDAEAAGGDVGSDGVLQMRLERDEFRCGFAAHWSAQDVDVVVCPVFVGPACAHDTGFYWNWTAFWNYVDCPGVVFPTPVRALGKGEEEGYGDAVPLGEECRHVRRLWEEGDFEGAPINLQIVARKYHDNELFAALGVLKDALSI